MMVMSLYGELEVRPGGKETPGRSLNLCAWDSRAWEKHVGEQRPGTTSRVW